jgi:hypothetical protein
MNEHLRERIARKLDALSDERGYQVLDYVEFLESRYAERQNASNAFTRFTEAVEDKLRAGKVSASAIAETMNLMNRAANVLGGALAAGQKMANELVSAPVRAGGVADGPLTSPTAAPSTTGATATTTAPVADTPASSPAEGTEAPGASGEKL